MPTKWYDAEVISIKNLSPNTKQFTLSIKDIVPFSFTPGQFITLDLPVSEKDWIDGKVILLLARLQKIILLSFASCAQKMDWVLNISLKK